jgi:regulator of cell morphogenesis and NO signaling
MSASAMKTVGELAVENPHATRVFEKLGIDYCCGGQRPLSEACAAAKVSVDAVLTGLEQAEAQAAETAQQKNWQAESISALVGHIVSTHHVYVKEEVPRIYELAAKVFSVHGKNHPELERVQQLIGELGEELFAHLSKEEQILFPYLVQAERAVQTGGPTPHSCFGTVQNPVRMMMMEHDAAGDALRELRSITPNYAAPADACTTYKTLYQAMDAFEKDLHQHIHLENNILFPRALEMEEAA